MQLPFSIASVELFVLIFIRISAALAVMPIFKHRAVPQMVKACFAVAMALLIVPSVAMPERAVTATIWDYAFMGLTETLCGLLMGFAGQFIFFAIDVCGRIIGLQSGLSIVSTIDPNSEIQSDVLTQIYEMLAILVFLSLDGHLMMLEAVRASFDAIAIGGLSLDGKLAEWSIVQSGDILFRGVQLAAPMMVTLFLSDVALGILTRVAPTMNVFVLGFPLKVGLTLMFAGLTTGTIAGIFAEQYADFARELPGFLRLLGN
ncbi:MAG: flagellar biosynthetic protein FliR [Calditrichaeota bacterium]|nr:flagellar biosynthetic protein FliR [Calditrichota bacterium]